MLVRAAREENVAVFARNGAEALHVEPRERWDFAAQSQKFLVKGAEYRVLACVAFVPSQFAARKSLLALRINGFTLPAERAELVGAPLAYGFDQRRVGVADEIEERRLLAV